MHAGLLCCLKNETKVIGIGGDRTGTFRRGGGDFAPDFGSKIGPFLGHFGQRQRVSGDLGASNTRFKAINRPEINSTVPPGAIFDPWGPVWNPNFRVFDPYFGPK